MVPGIFNDWTIYEGSRFSARVLWPGIADATGYSAHMMIRRKQDPGSAEILDLTEGAGNIALSIVDSQLAIDITIDADDTEGLDFPIVGGQHIAHYDLEIEPPVSAGGEAATWRALMGTIAYSRQVTTE